MLKFHFCKAIKRGYQKENKEDAVSYSRAMGTVIYMYLFDRKYHLPKF